ncbi:carbamoyltransferase [Rhizocola hellebori]|uniref:Carbamoyltransferase n=1 Tax=Rhizocola hellebori TaxID=1392758 RepID=A0A8J3VFV2_9ACTN|nr:carbamoyltransferase [Rhizocola hellebori]
MEGVVQGVGFRPFVYSLAKSWQLSGVVGNNSLGAFVELEGSEDAVAGFQRDLRLQAPPLAVIDRVTAREVTPTGLQTGFRIAGSQLARLGQTQIAPDCATCADCLRELTDPDDRRYGYPFINCTNCGPRLTIVQDVPYDRPRTTMAGFPMCEPCRREYDDPGDRRFHAQPVCCADCGPRLRLSGFEGGPGEVIAKVAQLLREGQIVAVKGLGGYHLAVDATSDRGTRTLRQRKHRDEKAFAVMVSDLEMARSLAEIAPADELLLTSPARPIVLVPRREPAGLVAAAVAPGQRQLGLMLPYTPLHVLLMREFAGPLVLTSGNVSEEPIAFLDGDARQRLGGIADAFLTHDRPIHLRVDDSVARSFRGEPMLIRRSRGYAPRAIRLPVTAARPVLGCGAELKSTFCLAQGDSATLSPHLGDLKNYETFRSYADGITHLSRLVGISPVVVAHDLHPDYLSTKHAQELAESGLELAGVQHHHAHIASCLVDNGSPGPVIGVAFDGTGYGTDGTLWGGEFLVADLVQARRAGHLAAVPMPGGESAVRQPWRMAAAYCAQLAATPAVAQRYPREWEAVTRLAGSGFAAPPTSSAGRLFDAVACLVGVRDEVSYEGQAAVELEQLANQAARGWYQSEIREFGEMPFQIRGADLVAAVLADLERNVPAADIAMRFHRGLALSIADGCQLIRETSGLGTVALSGGVFQNVLLLELAVAHLERRGFKVLTHRRIPANDGGISIGQAAIAATRDAGSADAR